MRSPAGTASFLSWTRSQTAGVFPIDVKKMHIDVLCFTGHKGLLGPQGTGGMYVREGVHIRPLKSGGSGVQTYSRTTRPRCHSPRGGAL